MDKEYNELQVIAGLQAGDQEVFRYLFGKYYTKLRYCAQRLVNNKEEARDIVSDAFEKFWKRRKKFYTLQNIKAFLYITVSNQCRDYLKSPRNRLRLVGDYTDLPLSLPPEEIETRIVQSDAMYQIYREAQNLPDKCREIFMLTYFERLKAGEVAESLNIEVSNVTSQLTRARNLLKLAFKNSPHILVLIKLLMEYCEN